jgi:hypothetical protein
MMNLKAMLMLLCTMFLTMGSTMGAPHLRALSGAALEHVAMSSICKEVGPGLFHEESVKRDRVALFVEEHNAVAGRCGPATCEKLCTELKAVGFESHGSGHKCECKFE